MTMVIAQKGLYTIEFNKEAKKFEVKRGDICYFKSGSFLLAQSMMLELYEQKHVMNI